jgi:hypothetical protein
MKKLLMLTLTLLTVVANLNAQKKSKAKSKPVPVAVPEQVKAAFEQKFPGVTAQWKETALGNFIAKFDQDSTQNEVSFDNAGNWTKTKTWLTAEKLPETVLAAIKTNYPNAVVGEVKKVVIGEKAPFYDITITDAERTISLLSDEAGTMTSSVVAKN